MNIATLSRLPVQYFHTSICTIRITGGDVKWQYNHLHIWKMSSLMYYAVNMFQWWSGGRISLIFSSLLRISKKDGLWFMSAAQHCSVNLKTLYITEIRTSFFFYLFIFSFFFCVFIWSTGNIPSTQKQGNIFHKHLWFMPLANHCSSEQAFISIKISIPIVRIYIAYRNIDPIVESHKVYGNNLWFICHGMQQDWSHKEFERKQKYKTSSVSFKKNGK